MPVTIQPVLLLLKHTHTHTASAVVGGVSRCWPVGGWESNECYRRGKGLIVTPAHFFTPSVPSTIHASVHPLSLSISWSSNRPPPRYPLLSCPVLAHLHIHIYTEIEREGGGGTEGDLDCPEEQSTIHSSVQSSKRKKKCKRGVTQTRWTGQPAIPKGVWWKLSEEKRVFLLLLLLLFSHYLSHSPSQSRFSLLSLRDKEV